MRRRQGDHGTESAAMPDVSSADDDSNALSYVKIPARMSGCLLMSSGSNTVETLGNLSWHL